MKWKMIFTLVYLGSILPSITFAQNLEVIGSCPLTELFHGGIYVQGDYAYISAGSSYYDEFSIINISDPTNPIVISSLDSLLSGSDITVIGNYAYVGLEPNHYLLDINIEDPRHPYIAGSLPLDWQIHKLYKRKNYVFLANCGGGMKIVDVSSPDNPQIVGSFGSPFQQDAWGVFVLGLYAYLSEGPEFSIINIQDHSNPVLIGHYSLETYANNIDVRVSGNYAYLLHQPVGGHNFSGIKILDISDPTNPQMVGSYPLTPCLCHHLFLDGNYLLVAHHNLSVLDISDPIHLQLAASYIDTTQEFGILDIYSRNGLIYALASTRMIILRFMTSAIDDTLENNPESFKLLANYPNPFNASTTIKYDLPKAFDVSIAIYDILGRKIETIVSGKQTAGSHSAIWNAKDAASGVYFYKIQAGDYIDTKRCLLLK